MSSHNGNTNTRSGNHALLTRTELVKLRQKALRQGTWQRALNTIERSLIDLAIATVNKIRSRTLAKSLTIVIKKLSSSMENNVIQCQIQTIGLPLARKLSKIAQNWGNKTATKWASDTQFARFLTICSANIPS